jgi:hypothetical protein
LQKTKNRLDSIDVILEKTQKIRNLLEDLMRNQLFTNLFYSKKIRKEQNEIIKNEFMLLINYISDLRNDLEIQLNEMPIILKNAKSELSKSSQ